MARILALDWDHRELHLVSADISRGKVHLERAVSWREEAAFLPSDAEDFGKRLRQHLKDANIAPAPVIVGLGRDRLVIKEVRYPQVKPEFETALVRNQIVKDLTEAAEDVLLDYFPLREASHIGEKRALSLVVRKDLVNGVQNVIKAAGLKLLAITARPFGVAACVKNLAGKTPQVPAPPSPDAVVGVLTAATGWGEFSAVRDDQLLFARSVAVGDTLLGEIRRNLAAYSGQPQLTFPRDALQALYVAGNGENAVLREQLEQTLGIPVYGLDPFAGAERVDVAAEQRAGFTGAVGLLQLWAANNKTPVNFVKPREVKVAASPTKRRFVLYGALAVLLIAVAAGIGYTFIREKQDEIDRLSAQKQRLDARVKELQPEIKYLEALKEWNDGAIPWLDELYDLAARSPMKQGFRVTQITIVPLQTTKSNVKEKDKDKDKDKEIKFTARMMIQGTVSRADDYLVQQLIDKINKDHPYCLARNEQIKTVGNPTDPKKSMEEFTIRVDLARRPPSAYTVPLVPQSGGQRPEKGFGKKDDTE